MRKPKNVTPISQEDREFLEEFIITYDKFLTYQIRKYRNSSIPLDDIRQETMLRLLFKVPELRNLEHAAACSYIFRTVQWAFSDLQRKEIRHSHISMDTILEEMVGEERDLVPDLFINHKLQRLRTGLPPREWLALNGKYFYGYSQEELGKQLDIAPNSVRSFLSRVRKHARELLTSEKVTGGDGDD